MNRFKLLPLITLILCLLIPVLVLAEPPTDAGLPDDYLGQLYGDLYVILRDADGLPVLDDFDCVQPAKVLEVDGVLQLVVNPLYTNEAEDIYCELTEDMLDWVLEVDFGRLNLGRSPTEVLNHAFDEAIKAMNNAQVITQDPAGRFVLVSASGLKTIDSPLENLAMYIKIMTEGHLITTNTEPDIRGGRPDDKGPPADDGPTLEERPVLSEDAISLLDAIGFGGLGDENNELDNNELLLTASLLAAAADKTADISVDTIVYINSIYRINDIGDLEHPKTGHTYFDFSNFDYQTRPFSQRSDPYHATCATGTAWLLTKASDEHWMEACVNVEGLVQFQPVLFQVEEGLTGPGAWQEGEGNVAGYAQAVDDALGVIQNLHNYSVPEILE